MSELLTLAQAAAALINATGDQGQADLAAFRDAYRLGFEAGWEVGRMQLDHELTEQDRRRTEYIHGLSRLPSYAELERKRWDGRREDFGKPRPGDFPGFGAQEAAA